MAPGGHKRIRGATAATEVASNQQNHEVARGAGIAIAEATQQAERITNPVQDPEAIDEVEALIQVVQLERVGTPVLGARVNQSRDRAESLAPAQSNVPAREPEAWAAWASLAPKV